MSYTEKVTITSGTHRGRKILIPNVEELRPTSSRVRETLFNWLTPHLHNATCLDWFSGSGILGFEALSRGAKHVDFFDTSNLAINNIKKHLSTFSLTNAFAITQDFSKVLSQSKSYDIIFVDPPYQKRLLPILLKNIEQLSPKLIYLEDNQPIEQLIESNPYFTLEKNKKTGNVYYGLLSTNKA